MALAVVLVAAGGGYAGGLRTSSKTLGKFHKITLPAMDSSNSNSCPAESAAYAAAIVDLEASQQVADDMYVAWYTCKFGHPPTPPDEPEEPPIQINSLDRLANTHSLLEQ